MKLVSFRRGRSSFSLVMIAATITVIGFVAFRFLDVQDNTQVAKEPTTTEVQVASVKSVEDVDTASRALDQTEAELDSIDSELDAEFDF